MSTDLFKGVKYRVTGNLDEQVQPCRRTYETSKSELTKSKSYL